MLNTTTTAYVLDFEEISAADLPLVGGKGANLGEMVKADFPVPPGFCLTTAAFERFIALSDPDWLYRQLDRIEAADLDSTRQIGSQIRQRLQQTPIPGDIRAAVLSAWKQHGTNDAYAVRSSATAEDLPDASFAGQQDTYLNVCGEEALLAAVRDCWASLFTDRAILYRIQNGFSHREVQLSVVVQRMVLPDISGILFTADPVSNHRHIATIDASFGLGEALVAGLVSADLYKVDKRSWQVVEAQIADKQLAIRPSRGGGTYQEKLADNLRHARVLNDQQVVALAQIGARIEAHFGHPQDIEWAIEQEAIYILQARPITTLFPLPEPQPRDSALHLYMSFNHAQVMTDPMPPMAHSVLRLLIPFGKQAADAYNPYLASAGGRLYADLTPLLHNRLLGPRLPEILSIADPLIADGMKQISGRPAFKAHARASHPVSNWTIIHFALPILRQIMALLWFKRPEEGVTSITERINRINQQAEARLAAAAPSFPRLQEAQRLLNEIFRREAGKLIPYVGTGILARVMLARLTAGHANPDDITAVQRGLSGNVTTEMDLRVGDLADTARQSPELTAYLLSATQEMDTGKDTTHPRSSALASVNARRVSTSFSKEVASLPGGLEFLRAWHAFLQAYGMRGPGEIDITRPRWQDDPRSLLQVIVGNLQTGKPGAHRQHQRQLAAAGTAAGERLIQAAQHGLLGPLRAKAVRRLVRVVRGYVSTREHPKFMIIRLFGLVRTVMEETAATLVADNRLDHCEDVWYLELPELIHALQQPQEDLRPRIQQRRTTMARYRQMRPPRVITSDGEVPIVSYAKGDLPDGALPGNPVSAGVVEGVAHVILDPTREVLSKGEILVAPFTDPGWTPLFINAAALVMEVGGMMTHGSVVAREYGIPAVVGVLEATTLLRTGQRIRVDGDKGYIELLDVVDC